MACVVVVGTSGATAAACACACKRGGGVRIYIEMMTNIYRAAKGFVTHVEDNVALMIRHANRNVVRLRSLFSDTHRELRSFAWVT